MNTSSQAVYSVYRAYLRQVHILPHSYLQHFFRIKARDDIEKILRFKAPRLRARNIKSVKKSVKKVQRANLGDADAFHHVLDLAYGRKGKMKWELLEPILYPKGPSPDPIIPGKEASRPPAISPTLQTLLSNPLSRTTKPLKISDAKRPRNLPPRANPLSEEARVFGPFSKRREVNIWKRFFKTETKKLLPPLAIEADTMGSVSQTLTLPQDVFPGADVFREAEAVAGPVYTGFTKTKRQREMEPADGQRRVEALDRHPSRWVRRRYRALLTKVPQLIYREQRANPVIKISSRSTAPYSKTPDRMPEADQTTMAWLQNANATNAPTQGIKVKR